MGARGSVPSLPSPDISLSSLSLFPYALPRVDCFRVAGLLTYLLSQKSKELWQKNFYNLASDSPLPISFFSFWLHHMTCVIVIPWLGIELGPSAVKAKSPNHWIIREVPIPLLSGPPKARSNSLWKRLNKYVDTGRFLVLEPHVGGWVLQARTWTWHISENRCICI